MVLLPVNHVVHWEFGRVSWACKLRVSLCGCGARREKVTRDYAKVTCKRCLRTLDRSSARVR